MYTLLFRFQLLNFSMLLLIRLMVARLSFSSCHMVVPIHVLLK